MFYCIAYCPIKGFYNLQGLRAHIVLLINRWEVIFTSGYTADRVLWEGLPGSAYIAKPASLQVYLNKIREVLDGNMTT
jgi:hypothetical protein